MTTNAKCYILSLKHSQGNMLTWWRPNESGYCWSLDLAGLYDEMRAMDIVNQSAFDGTRSCVAVPEDLARSLSYRVVENDTGNLHKMGTSPQEAAQARANG